MPERVEITDCPSAGDARKTAARVKLANARPDNIRQPCITIGPISIPVKRGNIGRSKAAQSMKWLFVASLRWLGSEKTDRWSTASHRVLEKIGGGGIGAVPSTVIVSAINCIVTD